MPDLDASSFSEIVLGTPSTASPARIAGGESERLNSGLIATIFAFFAILLMAVIAYPRPGFLLVV
ncbi:hypothetical protein LJR030_002042 [Rhizobium sp. LjRoot30]|uniref:hypothetical protein n=1 Tax=Rhizobium sp. LjRoot30 TaxID=3342320 RepID=UPI003ECDD3A2